MKTNDMIELNGIVTELLPNSMFFVDVGSTYVVLTYISPKLQVDSLHIGDKVVVQMSPYDLTRGRIIGSSNFVVDDT